MKEIGSIFTLTAKNISENERRTESILPGKILYSLGREALGDIARHCEDGAKTVLIPAYTFQTVIDPFQENGWNIVFYSIHKDLHINLEDLKNKFSIFSPSLIVVHPYFGMDLDEDEDRMLTKFHENGIKIIVDLTQCLFSEHNYSYAHYIVGSYRKWFPVPDGGFLITNSSGFEQPKDPTSEFSRLQTDAMYLRNLYFNTSDKLVKDISIRINKAANFIATNTINPHRISDLAYNLLLQQDTESNRNQRLLNFKYLYNNIIESEWVKKVCSDIVRLTTAPLYFTIYVKNRKELQNHLARNSIYAPVIWPVEEDRVLINDDIKYIYESILAIPCDQRYDNNDMKRIVNSIKEFNNGS